MTLSSSTKSLSKSDLVFSLTFAFVIVFLQFQFGLYRNFPITVSLIALPFVMSSLFSGDANPVIKMMILFSFCLNIIVYFMEADNLDGIQWIQSFALFNLTYYGIYSVSRDSLKNTTILVSAIRIVIPVCFAFSLLQSSIGFGRYHWLDIPFGNFSNLNTHKLNSLASVSRAPGFYIEPSYNALVAICLLPVVALLKSNRQRWIYMSLISLWLLATRSFSGLMTMSIILLLKVLFTKKKSSIDIFILVIYALVISGYTLSRIESITQPGSSAYFRLISPIKIYTTNLEKFPLGVPLGVREMLVISSSERLEDNLVTSIDNGWLYILIYFGLFGIVFLTMIMVYCLRLSLKLRNLGSEYWVFGLLPVFTLGFTGGITMPEFILLSGVMISLIRGHLVQTLMLKRLDRNEV